MGRRAFFSFNWSAYTRGGRSLGADLVIECYDKIKCIPFRFVYNVGLPDVLLRSGELWSVNGVDGDRFSITSTEVPCSGGTGRGGDTLVEGTSVAEVLGRASGASGYWDVDEVWYLLGNTELKEFRFTNCFVADCLSSWAVYSFTHFSPSSERSNSLISLSWIRGDTQWAGGPCTAAASGTKTRH